MSREQAALLGGNRTLAAIITDPGAGTGGRAPRLAAVCLNAGVIHRVGPSRLYVHVARTLAGTGWFAARFDHSGLGDSPVRKDGLSFEQSAVLEAREVMDALAQSRKVDRFVLIGLCSGAATAFDAALADERVAGAVLINPWGFDQSAAWNEYVTNRGHARKYWTRSLFSVDSWRRALTGRIDYRRLAAVLRRQATAAVAPTPSTVTTVATRVASDLDKLLRRGVRVLLVCSEGDEGIEYMNTILGRDVRRAAPHPGFDVQIMAGADHSLTLLDSQRRVVHLIAEWAARFAAATGPRPEPCEAALAVAATNR